MSTSDDPSRAAITIRVAFSGGLELLFQNRKQLALALPASPAPSLAVLIDRLAEQCDPRKRELFLQDGTVRPGILVLINDADWELEGEGEYRLQDDDEILFVSTLHGG